MTACATCGREKSQGQCWLLSCPTNGGSGQALAMMLDARLYGIGTMKDGRHIPPHDLFANVDDPDNAPTKATAHMIEDEDDD